MRLGGWNEKQDKKPKFCKIKLSFSNRLYFVNNCHKKYEHANAITESCHLAVTTRKLKVME